MTVSRETERLNQYAGLMRKWNKAINLVAPSTLDALEERHISDSRKLAELSKATVGDWVDLGSGGGLPGLVLAINQPDRNISLVESDKRKCSFLRNVCREVGLMNVAILNERIEMVEPLSAQNISARALAPLPLLLSYVDRHLASGGRAWLMKGRNWRNEVDEARKDWSFNLTAHRSATDPDSAILEMTDIRHA
ncbi:16S rRNA (guanine(527)-N(7))-methyltransferase RsmG [Paracoccus sp. MBLB3053]|uniref:Ribosomal RNA small subunit methyltransferase G n=1 Tax=Paracoccus aurantius TaxID=3073814 RepID=A0ABU2HQK3_9RHOB|nr:16S rRNA (guanine(527)-N(7))-methyltransferase RsmG [Paracoccus sp. MBLB3053]MDS9466820.1 16S rRNA (guanine(527)-N(7))-methyltransferase RsmG [Paracoccus sp. MBLB3053]